MKHSSLFSTMFLALGATAAGCAASAPGMGDDGTGSGSGSGSGAGLIPTSAEGKFAVRSDFDIATNMPGTAGDVINEFIKATDGSRRSAKYILEKLVDQLRRAASRTSSRVPSRSPRVT